MNKDEALKLALEALEEAWYHVGTLKEALAQPERDYERGFIDGMQKQMQSSVDKAVNAMTQPTYFIPSKDQRTWVGMRDEEIDALLMEVKVRLMGTYDTKDIYRAVEAALKERNT